MANEIYHKSNWGKPKKDGWGDVYFNPSATNQLYTRSDNYENVEGTDKALASKPDTQSVLMTPTAYSVGSMNSILPPYEVLSELITNGDFATDSDWAKGTGWTISGGKGIATNTSIDSIYQDVLTLSKSYKVSFKILSIENGSLKIGIGINFSQEFTEVGTYTYYGTPLNDGLLRITPSNGTNATIDNVSVKEVINADFTFDRNSTATRVNKEGLIETVAIDTPRLDYPFIDGVVQSEPSLLLEPTRTNSIPYSEDFDNSDWTKTNVTVTADATIAPDGTLNASKLTENTGNGTHRISDTTIVSGTGVAYTQSVFAKSGGSGRYLRMFRGSGTYNDAVFDLENGTVVTTDGNNLISVSIEEHSNGWYRCISTYTTQFSNIATYYGLQNGITDSYTGDGTSHIYLWGAQLEQGSYPTSYIPTSGSAVTRAAETANGAGTSDDFNDSEGVLFAEIAYPNPTTSSNLRIAISDGTTSNRVLFQNVHHTANRLQFYVIVGTSTVSTDFYIDSSDITLFNKIAFKYKTNDFSVWINGVKVLTDTSGITFPSGTLTELAFDSGDGLYDWYGKTKELSVFKTALTDSELESLTSWDSFSDMATGQLYSIR